MMKRLILSVIDGISWILDHYCLAEHKHDTSGRECWECGYACQPRQGVSS
jgi:hypothetical protein